MKTRGHPRGALLTSQTHSIRIEDQRERMVIPMIRFRDPSLVIFGLLISACDSPPKADPQPSNAAAPQSKPADPEPESQALTTTADAKTKARPIPASALPVVVNDGTCKTLCQATAKLKCGGSEAECTEICLEMLKLPECSNQGQAFVRCAAKQPLAKFECDQGSASLLSNVCVSEQEAFVNCLGDRAS